jgi:hypothetical protein
MRRLPILALLLPLAPSAWAAADACRASSPEARAQLLELYTSEGCNSCPPAERWFATIAPGEALIPLAFHVDYWDKLGWKDAYSDHRNTERQLRYASLWGEPAVYTPQVFLDGHELREWRRGVPGPKAGARAPRLVLSASRTGGQVDARLESRDALPREALAVFALVEGGLTVDIRAGENKGATLRHEHVVRAYAEQEAAPSSAVRIAIPPGFAPERGALVAWIQDARDGTPVQAVRLPLAACGRG